MDDDEVKEMISRITERLDYDLYKSLFVDEFIEDQEEAIDTIDQLIDIVKEYLPL